MTAEDPQFIFLGLMLLLPAIAVVNAFVRIWNSKPFPNW